MIIISPYAKKLLNGNQNPKNYPYWKELIAQIKEPVIQVGIEGEVQLVEDFRKNLPISELRKLLQECRTWISCDSFFQHLGWDEGKQGVVLWSVSDPLIFGHPENINLLKDRSNLVENQFLWWEFVEHKNDRFVKPKEVLEHLYKE
jgi:ADP-heptose:LPS heptosyltransferase